MQSRNSILRAAGTSAIAVFLVAAASFATSAVVGARPAADAQPVSFNSDSADPSDELETEDPSDELETEDEDAGATGTPEHEDASFDDHGGASDMEDDQGEDEQGEDEQDDRSGTDSGSDHEDSDDDHSGSSSGSEDDGDEKSPKDSRSLTGE